MSTKPEYTLVKLIVCLQTLVELFDELQGTAAYKHNLKRQINLLAQQVESELSKIYSFIDDNEKEETFMSIQRAITKIVESPVEELFEEGFKKINT